MAVTVHHFGSSGEAYDASQTHDEIKDGDVLSVASEHVVGVLVKAWVVAVGENTGQFHELASHADWAALNVSDNAWNRTELQDYSASFAAAVAELDRLGMAKADAAFAAETERVSASYRFLDERKEG
jgi:hypothetical protein